MPVIVAQSTTDSFTGVQLVNLQPTSLVVVQVANNPVLYQYAINASGASSELRGSQQWMPPDGAPLLPGLWTFQGPAAFGGYTIGGFRIKSQVVGKSAVVNVTTVP